MKSLVAIAPILLAGCTTTTGGSKWYAPATWFSHAPATASDKAEAKEEVSRHAVIKAAQRTAHQTQVAIAAAPASRPVATAADFNSSTVALLDQAEGPLQSGEIDKLRSTVVGLLSENAAVRDEAERQREKEREAVNEISGKLAKAERDSEQASEKLRAAFERENALANELRSQRAFLWIACGVAALLGVGWLYVRIALGGVPVAIGRALGSLRTSNPTLADQITPLFDQYLNRHEQELIAKNAR